MLFVPLLLFIAAFLLYKNKKLFIFLLSIIIVFFSVRALIRRQYRIENNIEVPIKELLNYSYSVAKFTGWPNLVLFKIIIPKKFKWELTQLLNQMNITAETLYPGLGGLAKSLSSLQLRDSDIYTE